MLVLLVIFMITAPLLQVGVPVDLPKTSAQQVGGKDEPLVVSVNSKDEVFLGETKYELRRARRQAQGGARGEARSARLHPRRQGDQLRPHDGSHGRGDRFRLPPARPARRAGAAAGRRRRRRRPAASRAPALRRPRRDGERWRCRRTSSVEMRTPAILSAGVHVVALVAAIVNFNFFSTAADGARAGDGRVRGDRQEGGGAEGRQSAAAAQGRQDRRGDDQGAAAQDRRAAAGAAEPPKLEVAEAKPNAPAPVEKPKPEPPKPAEDVIALKPKEPEPPKDEKKPEPPKPEPPKPEVKKVEPPKPPPPKPEPPRSPTSTALVDSILKNKDKTQHDQDAASSSPSRPKEITRQAPMAPKLAAVVTASEIEGVRNKIRPCWNPLGGVAGTQPIVTLVVQMNQDGTPVKAEIQDSGRYNSDPGLSRGRRLRRIAPS